MDMTENQSNYLPVSDIIETLNLLVTPSSSGQKCEEPAPDPFLQHLKRNLERVDERLSDTQFLPLSTALKERIGKTEIPGASCSWQYVNCILQLLHLLSQALLNLQKEERCSSEGTAGKGRKPKSPEDAPPLRKTALSMKQITTIKTALQFVTSMGICPHLASGVGIPLQYGSRAASLFPHDPASAADTNMSSENNRARLSVCTSVLGETIQVEELKSIVLSEAFLAHILAALLQQVNEVRRVSVSQTEPAQSELAQQVTPDESKKTACQQPQDSACAEQLASSSDRTGDSVSSSSESGDCEKRDLVCVSRAGDERCAEDCQKMLSCVLSSANPVLLMRMLMVLQNGIPEKFQRQRNPRSPVIRPPAWLKKHCSQLLFTLSEQPHGILHVFEAIRSSAPDQSPSGMWRHCGVVANIISGKYNATAKDRDQYLVNVTGQLMDLLHTKGSDADNLGILVGRVAATMTTKCDGFRGFHSRLLQPLCRCLEGWKQQGQRNGAVLVSEEELTDCLLLLHKVYIRGQQPLSDLLSVLKPVVDVLWALFCVTHSGVSIIKQWVKDLLVSYLKWAGREEAALFLGKQGEVTLPVNFDPGPQGGLQAVHCDPTGLDEEQHVAAMISVLQELKTEAVAGELLVNLLKVGRLKAEYGCLYGEGLTEIISKETQHTDVLLPARVQRAEVKEEKKGELKRRVTMLHQIASICETFGSECLTDNSHILLFVKASLERAVVVCRGTTDEETVAFEMSTLSMTLALLSAVMAGALEMKEEDRLLMDSMLPLLEVIGQDHADDFIREMASDIRIAIATRGAVWSSVQQSKKGEKKSKPPKKEVKRADVLEPKKKAATLTSETESLPLLTDLSLKKKKAEPKQASQPRRPLIEVLSEHTFSDSEAAEENLSSSDKKAVSKPLIEELGQSSFRTDCETRSEIFAIFRKRFTICEKCV